MIIIFGLLYAILMISIGMHEIFLYSTGESEFLSCLLLTFFGSLLLLAFIWQFSAKSND